MKAHLIMRALHFTGTGLEFYSTITVVILTTQVHMEEIERGFTGTLYSVPLPMVSFVKNANFCHSPLQKHVRKEVGGF